MKSKKFKMLFNIKFYCFLLNLYKNLNNKLLIKPSIIFILYLELVHNSQIFFGSILLSFYFIDDISESLLVFIGDSLLFLSITLLSFLLIFVLVLYVFVYELCIYLFLIFNLTGDVLFCNFSGEYYSSCILLSTYSANNKLN